MLLDTDVGRVLPWCEVVVIWGENTLWEIVGAAWAVRLVPFFDYQAGASLWPIVSETSHSS
jgi:hypothetical protein